MVPGRDLASGYRQRSWYHKTVYGLWQTLIGSCATSPSPYVHANGPWSVDPLPPEAPLQVDLHSCWANTHSWWLYGWGQELIVCKRKSGGVGDPYIICSMEIKGRHPSSMPSPVPGKRRHISPGKATMSEGRPLFRDGHLEIPNVPKRFDFLSFNKIKWKTLQPLAARQLICMKYRKFLAWKARFKSPPDADVTKK